MTTGCPNASVSCWPTVRATMSVGPPAAKGTMMRTGLDGNVVSAASTCGTATQQTAHNSMLAVRFIRLLQFNFGFFLHALPLRETGTEAPGKFVGRAGYDLGAEPFEAIARRRQRQRLKQRGINLVHDFLRHGGR